MGDLRHVTEDHSTFYIAHKFGANGQFIGLKIPFALLN